MYLNVDPNLQVQITEYHPKADFDLDNILPPLSSRLSLHK